MYILIFIMCLNTTQCDAYGIESFDSLHQCTEHIIHQAQQSGSDNNLFCEFDPIGK